MEIITCGDLIMKTNLSAVDGKIVYPKKEDTHSLDLLNIEPNQAEDGGFIFYSKENPQTLICKIGYTEKRENPELYYDTEPDYRRKGHMSNAMNCVLDWCRNNSVTGKLWLLIGKDNTISQKVAHKFNFVPQGRFSAQQEWYCLTL